MNEHTPTPWHIDTRPAPCSHCAKSNVQEYAVIGADGAEIALDSPHDAFGPNEANSAYIIRACNAHDHLISALERARSCINRLAAGKPERALAETLGEVDSALAKAKGETP